jgi:anti-anti-sigma regulatory factor
MNQKFQSAVHQRDDVVYVKLSGVIDEDNELGELTEKIPSGTAVIDLSEIERINSCGVRDWVNWLGRVEKQGSRVVLVECSPAIVAQINLVNNFTGTGVVKSFFAPYFCPNCDREKVLLIESGDMGTGPHKAPTCRCDECDGSMDFDDMEDSYFAFLSNARKVAEAAKIQSVVNDLKPSDAEKSKIRSRVGTQTSASSSGGSASSSLPSVPSLPSISRGSTGVSGVGSMPGQGFGTGNRSFSGGGSRPGISGSDPGRTPTMPNPKGMASAAPQPKSNAMVYVLVALLIAAICVLAVLLFVGSNRKKSSGLEPAGSHHQALLVTEQLFLDS